MFQSATQNQNQSVQTAVYQTSSFQDTKQPALAQQVIEKGEYIRQHGSNTIKDLGGQSRVVKRVIHYDNPRKYIESNYNSSSNGNSYKQQSINYSNQYQCSCSCQCTCSSVKLSSNPNYRFQVTKEFDIRQEIKQEEQNYEQLLLKIQNLESLHYQEVSKLKQELEISRIEKQQILAQSSSKEQHVQVIEKEVVNTFEIDFLKQTNAKLEQKILSQKEKKKVLAAEILQYKEQLFQRDTQIRTLTLQHNEESHHQITTQQINPINIELESQNQYLIQELGRIREEYETLQKSSRVVEKLVYVPTVQNVTTIKEVPPYIEEKVVYVQDIEQLEQSQAIISQLQSEINLLNQDKQNIILKQNEEKTQLLEKITLLTNFSKQSQPNVLKEVIVQKVIDRSEIEQKEEELSKQYKQIQEYSLRIKELEQIVSNLQLELSKLQRHYKIVKLPNNYRLEETVSQQTHLLSQSYQIQSQPQVYGVSIQNSIRQHQTTQGQIPDNYQYSTYQTIKKTQKYQDSSSTNLQHHQGVSLIEEQQYHIEEKQCQIEEATENSKQEEIQQQESQQC